MKDNKDVTEVLELMEQSRQEFEQQHKEMPDPKFERGDVVTFQFSRQMDVLQGMIEIVDRYGTFEQNEEPSYDIYRFENNTLYKHVRESCVVSFVRKGSLEEIEDAAKRFSW